MLPSAGTSTGWCRGIFAQLADLGAAKHIDQDVRLTELGGALAAAASAVIDTADERLDQLTAATSRPEPLPAKGVR